MPWFKVDDSFYDHPKFLGLSNAAVGLWVKAGAWCGKHLTDGVIPAEKVKTLRGTPAQIRDLIAAGLWVECESEVGAKAYRFHDWIEYQPTRKQTLKERADSAERQRKSRERKAQEQAQQENVTRDSRGHVTRDSHESHNTLSQRPDPTRPDPSLVGVHAAASYNVDSGDSELAAAVDRAVMVRPGSRPGLASAVANLTRQGYLDDDIIAGLKAWQSRPNAGPGLLRNLVDDAQEQRLERSRAGAEHAVIDACEMCDDRGLVEELDRGRRRGVVDTTDTSGRPVAVKCNHTTPPPRPESTHTPFRPTSDPNTRKALFNALNERTVPQPPF